MRVRPICAFALFVAACGGGAPPKKAVSVPPPPKVAVAPAAKPLSPARWHLLPDGATEVRAAPLDLGASRRLYVTTSGERWMSNQDTLVAAPTLSPGPLAGALQDGAGFTFLTNHGRVFRAAQPLGELVLAGALPLAAAPGVRSVATAGKAALLVLVGGALHRSTDRGATWSKVGLPTGAFHPASVALGPNGEGLLVAHPQRVFVTADDGATWSPLATPGVGASEAVTDATGRVFLRGYQDSAVLEKGQLTPGSHPSSALPNTKAGVNFSWGTRWAIDDERVAVLSQQGKDHELRVGPLSALGPPHPVDLGDCQQPQLALHAGRVLIACDVSASKGTVTTRILSSDDRGKSFREEATLPSGSSEARQELAAGPRGFVFLNRRCSYVKSQRECVPARVRPAGFDAFVPLTHAGLPIGGSLVKNGLSMEGTIEQVVLSKTGDRYYVLVSDYTGQAVYAGGIEESDLVLRASLEGPSFGNHPMAMAVDDGGHLVLARRRTDGWLIRRVREDGSDASTSWVPLAFEHLALHGSRGLGITADGRAFETADAGYHFREVAAPTRSAHDLPFVCGPLGCVVGHRIREGWDDPAAGGALLSASPAAEVSEAPNPYQHRRPPGAKSVYGTPFRCTLAGPKLALGRVPFVGYASSAKWTSFVMEGKDAFAFPVAKDDGAVTARLLTKNKKEFAVREVALLGPEPTDDKGTVHTRAEVQPGGVIALRYQTTKSAGTGKTSDPVDVELAWWTAHDDKVHRAKVTDHPAFRLPTRWQNDSTTWLDKDGLWFRGGHDGTAPLLFLRGGTAKAEEIPWPKVNDYLPGGFGVTRVGARIVLFSRTEQNADAARIWVRDGDGAWVKHVWALAPVQVWDSARPWVPSRQPTLHALPFGGSGAYLSTFYDGLAGHTFLTPVTTATDPATTGPNAVLALPPATTLSDALHACDESTRGAPRGPLPWAVGTRRPVVVEGASDNGQEFAAGTAETLLRFPAGGPPCGRALGFSRWSTEAGVVPLDDLQFGLFLRVDTNRDQSATLRGQRLACTLDKGGKLPTSLEEEEGFWQ